MCAGIELGSRDGNALMSAIAERPRHGPGEFAATQILNTISHAAALPLIVSFHLRKRPSGLERLAILNGVVVTVRLDKVVGPTTGTNKNSSRVGLVSYEICTFVPPP